MIDTIDCDDKDLLVAYLYDEIDPVIHRRVADHLRICAACTAELAVLGNVRHALAEWVVPDAGPCVTMTPDAAASLNGAHAAGVHGAVLADLPAGASRVVDEPASRWAIPAWAQAAAAVLVLSAGLAIANLQIRYDANGLAVSTGWMQPGPAATVPAASPASASASGSASAAQEAVGTTEAWRPALVALEEELRAEIRATHQPQAVSASEAASRTPDMTATLERVAALIAESELRQQRELALRLTQFGRDIEVQRRTDNRRNFQAIGQFEGRAGAEMQRQRQALDYIMRVSTQPPPQ